MVLAGKVNKGLVSLLQQHNGKALELRGTDGGMLIAEKIKSEVDLGYVGQIKKIDVNPIVKALDDGYIPVVATVASSEDGEIDNINADTAAAQIAAALNAEESHIND